MCPGSQGTPVGVIRVNFAYVLDNLQDLKNFDLFDLSDLLRQSRSSAENSSPHEVELRYGT